MSGSPTVAASVPTRVVWRPPWYIWTLLGIGALALVYELFPERVQGDWRFVAPVLVLGGVLVVRRLWELPPAVTLCATIALTIFSDGWSQMGLGGIPLNRLLVLIVFLQFALKAPGVTHVPRPQLRNVHILMGLTAIYALISAAAAETLTSASSLLPLTDIFGIVPFLLFFLAPSIFSGSRERNLLLATLVGLGLYLGVTAIFETIGPRSLVFPSYIVLSDQISPGTVQAGGPFQSPVAEGFAAFACAVASLMAFIQWRSYKRYLAALSVVVCAYACFVTLERGVWIAAAAATVTTALATRAGRRWLIPGILACSIGVGAVLLLSSELASSTSERANYQLSVWDRKNQTAAGLRMIEAKPLFGFGWDRYQSDSLEYFRQATDYPMTGHTPGVTIGLPQHVSPLHNTYLSYGVELGLVGTFLWLASLFWGVGSAIFSRGSPSLRQWKLGLIALTVFFLVISFVNPREQPFPIVLLLAWAGVAIGSSPSSAAVKLRSRIPALGSQAVRLTSSQVKA